MVQNNPFQFRLNTRVGRGYGQLVQDSTPLSIPTISSITPNEGAIDGGDSVSISGTDFLDGATVTIGGNAATNVVVVSDTSITCDTPAGIAIGSVDVVVTNPDAQVATLTDGFAYFFIETFATGFQIPVYNALGSLLFSEPFDNLADWDITAAGTLAIDDDTDDGNVFGGNCLKGLYNSTGEVILNAGVSESDVVVYFDFYGRGSFTSYSQRFFRVGARVNGINNDCYFASMGNVADYGHLKIYKRVSGVYTTLADGTRFDLVADTKYRLLLSCNANHIEAYLLNSSGLIIRSHVITDAAISSAGSVSVQILGSAGNSVGQTHHVDDLKVYEGI